MSQKITIEELMELESIDKLDKEELALHNKLKKGNFKLLDDKKTKEKYAKIFKEANHKRKALSLRMPENDYIGIRAKALELGMPYQTLINSVIHRFLTGDLR